MSHASRARARRERAQRLHDRVDRVLTEPAEPRDDGQDHGEAAADREADSVQFFLLSQWGI